MQKTELQDSGSFGVKAAPQAAAGMQGGLDRIGLCLPAEGFIPRDDLSYFPERCSLRLNSGQAASD